MTLKTWTEAVRDWLPLVETSGVYLAPKVLDEAFPQSLDPIDTAVRQRARSAWEEWRDAVDDSDPRLPDLHREWVNFVLGELLEYRGGLLRPGEGGQGRSGDAVQPDWLLGREGDAPKVAVFVLPPDRSPNRASKDAASLLEQATAWCRTAGVRSALLTDGEQWTLLDAPEGAVSGHVTWHARLWWLEPVTLRAFCTFLNARTVFGGPGKTFPALLDRSLEFKDEVTTTLGTQVERAVEVLVRALDRADRDKRGTLLRGVSERELYEAGLTVMMRLVFVLSAEERGLLLLGEPVWDSYYAVSTLRAQLEEMDDRDGHGVLERRYDAWSRLLAVFRAVYGGVDHETLRLPALGGSLFDPDRFPFLEGRAVGTGWHDTPAEPLPIDNRTVLLLLDALQRIKGKDGAQTLSYRALDVEQIGHVYEGLLERTVSRVPDVTLGLDGTGKSKTPDVLLADLESAQMDGRQRLLDVVAGHTARTIASSRASLGRILDRDVPDDLRRRLRRACGSDELARRVLPFVNLLRTDPWDEPVVYPQHAFTVTSGSDRSTTGAHYTPKVLTERIVGTTLEPLAYVGPAEGLPREEWTLKSAAELLDLKVCDPAMGSGAFLVQVCRWLGDRMVLAWTTAEVEGRAVTAEGDVVPELGGAEAMTTDPEDRLLQARRLVAERCLYGVDINPVAVELAKLSIWLVTLAKNRPFGFLDHNLRHGDSLLGIRDLKQLTELSMTPVQGAQQRIFSMNVREAVDRAVSLRTRLRAMPIRDIRDVEAMARLNLEARTILQRPELAADALIGEAMRHAGNTSNLSAALNTLSIEVGKTMDGDVEGERSMKRRADAALVVDLRAAENPRRPFHWPLEFPEVFLRENGGFDAIVGNPPFLGGKRITGILGKSYRNWIVKYLANGKKGSADLAAYFLLSTFQTIRQQGCIGIVAVNTIAEGDTREIGIDMVLNRGGTIYSAYPNEPWQGSASVITSCLQIYKGKWLGEYILSGKKVDRISSFLSYRKEWTPERLETNSGRAYIGSFILGKGFILSDDKAQEIIRDDEKYRKVVYPLVNGEDLNSSPTQSSERWVINFWDWSEDEAKEYTKAYKILLEKAKPERDKLSLDSPDGRRYRNSWWRHGRDATRLYHAIGRGSNFMKHPPDWKENTPAMHYIIAGSVVSKYSIFSLVPSSNIYSHAVVIIASGDFWEYALLNSSIHGLWSRIQGSYHGGRVRYTPSDVYETFAYPAFIDDESYNKLDQLGEELDRIRRFIMKENNIGLTQIYNRFHDPNCNEEKIAMLRAVHEKIDLEIIISYEWSDIHIRHDFFSMEYLNTKDKIRYSIDEKQQNEIFSRLLELNRVRFDKFN